MRALVPVIALVLVACGSSSELDGSVDDAGPDDAGGIVADAGTDAGPRDGGMPRDGGRDAGRDAGRDGGPICTFYRDADGDGFGDPAQTVMASCSTPPAGFVANGDDCYDDNADANPDQTAWSGTDRGDGSFDWNCDGDEEPLYPDIGLCPDTTVTPPIPGTVGWCFDVPACGVTTDWKSNAAICGCLGRVQQRCR